MGKAADLILTGGRVCTMDRARPDATALAIAAGRIVALGGDEVVALAGPGTRVVALGGRAVMPGLIDSLSHDPARAGAVPLRRIGKADEVARTAAFLLSDDAGYITGQSIRIDGGATRHV